MSLNRRGFLGVAATASVAGVPGMAQLPGVAGATADPNWAKLRNHLTGELILPADAQYGQAKQVAFAQYDSADPAAVAYCASAQDVRTCLLFAQHNGVPVTPRAGGHSHTGYSTGAGLIIDVSRLNSVEVGQSTVTIGGGTKQVDALAALEGTGLALPGGMHPTVSAGGFLQGGGYGLLTRSAGMACDHMVSAEVVLADGRIVLCSAYSEPDLFWALRGGGGGNFGIVTRYELVPVQLTRLVNFTLSWPSTAAAAVLAAWPAWVIDGSRELGTALTIGLGNAAPGTEPAVVVTGGWTGALDGLTESLDSLAALVGQPAAARTVQELSYRDAMMYWYGCSDKTAAQCHLVGQTPEAQLPRGAYLRTRNRLFSQPLPASGVDELLAAFNADRRAGHRRALSGAAFGGKANDPARTSTAYVHRDSEFMLVLANSLATATPAPEERAAAEAWVDNGFAAWEPYANGESYQNIPDPVLTDWRTAYYAENYARLADVKHRYDPDRVFQFPQAVG
jgi:FAD/FMN-containing dehydrogenase